MARLDRQHKLDGFSGEVGKNLRLTERSDGRLQVGPYEPETHTASFPHWQIFKDAIAYARTHQHMEAYEKKSVELADTPFHVATADFLHPPEIHEIDLSEYHGRPGDVISIKAMDDIEVTRVGILITDHENHLIEMGMATRAGKDTWRYVATQKASGHHVRVIVDAADLPGHLDEARAEKRI